MTLVREGRPPGLWAMRAHAAEGEHGCGLVSLPITWRYRVRFLVCGNRVADGDLAIGEDVGVEPAAVDEFLYDPGPRHLLQVQARLAEFDAETLDIADPKAPADQLVEPHAPHDYLTARLSAGQAGFLQRFGLDQGQRLAGLCALPAEVAVAAESLARQCADRLDRHDRIAWADVDRLDVHEPILAGSAAGANPVLARECETCPRQLHIEDLWARGIVAAGPAGQRPPWPGFGADGPVDSLGGRSADEISLLFFLGLHDRRSCLAPDGVGLSAGPNGWVTAGPAGI